jgi:VIT1/CCC1 family predicted Fe2+/Mn2+ transporter
MYTSAFTIGFGYFIGGLIPLIPYFFTNSAEVALLWSAVITGIILLLFGAFRTHISGGADAGVGAYIKGALNMFLVGGAAAGSAYLIVAAMEGAKS